MFSSDKNQNYTRKAMTELNDKEVRQLINLKKRKITERKLFLIFHDSE